VSTQTTPVLERILAETRAEVQRRKRELPLAELAEQATLAHGDGPSLAARRLRGVLARPGLGVIAEFKRRSPSAGALRAQADVRTTVGAYVSGGADALSVLTEGPNFGGSLEDLRAARAACELPVLRKDFVIDPYQLYEARAAGADAVLLIVAALETRELAALHERARALGLDALVEVHDETELHGALGVGAELVGINNRDLRDFSVDVERTFRLREAIPAGVRVVSESGIATAAQLRRLRDARVDAVLIGESLMRAADPEAALKALRAGEDLSEGPENI
jgi:indole-3-glycerol phosphate synthase